MARYSLQMLGKPSDFLQVVIPHLSLKIGDLAHLHSSMSSATKNYLHIVRVPQVYCKRYNSLDLKVNIMPKIGKGSSDKNRMIEHI